MINVSVECSVFLHIILSEKGSYSFNRFEFFLFIKHPTPLYDLLSFPEYFNLEKFQVKNFGLKLQNVLSPFEISKSLMMRTERDYR